MNQYKITLIHSTLGTVRVSIEAPTAEDALTITKVNEHWRLGNNWSIAKIEWINPSSSKTSEPQLPEG